MLLFIVLDTSSQQIRSSKSPKRLAGDVTSNSLDEAAKRLAFSVADAQQSAVSALAERKPTQSVVLLSLPVFGVCPVPSLRKAPSTLRLPMEVTLSFR